jgi:molecular chaperone HtpG
MSKETMNFGADVSRLLEIVAHALYSNRDVFLRELVSNASDACDRLRYEAINKPSLTEGSAPFAVRVTADTKARTLTVTDNGIGMNREDLVSHLGTIAKSGTKAIMDQIASSTNNTERLSLIGQFGVGFYASFMVAKNVEVVSRKAGEDKTWLWESDGRTGFTVREAKKDEAARLTDTHGTAVTLHVNDDASDYLVDDKLKTVIQTWSDHINIPVTVGAKDEPVNKGSALWMRPKAEITEEQYTEFYRHIGHGMDDPMLTSHWRAEGKIEYNALLFVPTMRPWDLYDPTRKNAVRLYVKRVFITDDCQGLMYPWLRFVRGVIDSEDLPLNISREMLQHNPVIDKIRNGVAKRILTDLDKLSREDADKYAAFWGQFGATLKEGLYDAFTLREDLLKVVRFHSTAGDRLTSLEDYVSRMKDKQDTIYYISGENLDNLRDSPQLEGFKARGLEVLLFTDTIDDFWLQSVLDYKGKPFQSVTRGSIDLSRFDTEGTKTEDAPKPDGRSPALDPLIDLIKASLSDEISDVRLSNRLTDSPVCLIAAENEVDLRMERVLRVHQQYKPAAKRVLELNAKHPLITRLADLAAQNKDGADLSDAAHLLLDQARIIQGEPVPDPSRFARSMSRFMERGLAA